MFFANCHKPVRCGYPTWCWWHLLLFRITLSLLRSLTMHLHSNHVSGILLQYITSLCFTRARLTTKPKDSNCTNPGNSLLHFLGHLRLQIARVTTAVFTKEILWDVVKALLLCITFSPTKHWLCSVFPGKQWWKISS